MQVQDEGDVDQLLDVEYEDDAVEDAFENEFGDMPGAAQVRTRSQMQQLHRALRMHSCSSC